MRWVSRRLLISSYIFLTARPSALKSPQILELSGIGQVGVLNKIGVPTNIELPGVGENIQEHIFAGLSYGKSLPVMYPYDIGLTR